MLKKVALVLLMLGILLFLLEANALVDNYWKITSTHGSVPSGYYLDVALDGSGNFTDIQKAIDAVPSGSPGVIRVRDGVYDLNPRFTYPFRSIVVRSNITVRGMGIDRTIIRSFPTKQLAGSNVRAMTITSKDGIKNLVIENLTVIQNGSPDNLGWSAIDLRGGANVNVVIRNVKVTDVTGAAIAIPRFTNLTIENCLIERSWTGIALGGGSSGLVKGNRLFNMTGDGIFPQSLPENGFSVTDLTIEDNYLENIGDTAIDITANSTIGPHERITAQRNILKNATVRVSSAQHIEILNNTVTNGWIDVDNGAGSVSDILVQGNKIVTSDKVGIGFYGAQNSSVRNNTIIMTFTSGTQSGIHAAIRGTALIEGNTIMGAKDYGISFAGWALWGTTNLTIRENWIQDFGNIGIWDDNSKQGGPVLIENNTIWDSHTPFVSRYGIRTDYEANGWTIRYNHVYAGATSFISAPGSSVYDNIYEPP